MKTIKHYWVSIGLLILTVTAAYNGDIAGASVLGVGTLLHIKLDEMTEE